METRFKIVDSIMGSGKTTQMMDFMKKNPDREYLYITPYLKEVDRVKNEMGGTFVSPPEDAYGKQNAFKQFVKEGRNIVTTHSLFLRLDEEAENLLAKRRYTLIMDEVLEVVLPYNNVREYGTQPMEPGDVPYMEEKGTIKLDEEGRVLWIEETNHGKFKYSDVQSFLEKRTLVCEERVLLWEFPMRVFKLFQEVYVLTYWFKGTVFCYYLALHKVNYEMFSLRNGNLTPHCSDVERRMELKRLITVIEDDRVNNVGKVDNSLSKSWYTGGGDRVKRLKTSINTVLKRYKVRSKDVMWTSFKRDYDRIRDKGYTFVRRLSKEEKLALKGENGDKKLMCFVPCSSRATNEFRDRTFLMYLVNRYWNPELIKFFAHRGVAFKEKECARAEMLQWIWRSAIRDGKPITIYIPSKRMRKLLVDWLDGKD